MVGSHHFFDNYHVKEKEMVIIIVHTKRPGGDLFESCRCQQGKHWTPPESL